MTITQCFAVLSMTVLERLSWLIMRLNLIAQHIDNITEASIKRLSPYDLVNRLNVSHLPLNAFLPL